VEVASQSLSPTEPELELALHLDTGTQLPYLYIFKEIRNGKFNKKKIEVILVGFFKWYLAFLVVRFFL